MKHLVEEMYTASLPDWDGTFAALDDVSKDNAARNYLLTEGQHRLTDLFPPCCNGAEVRLIKELYCRPLTFKTIYLTLMTGHDKSERFESEACRGETSWELSKSIQFPGTIFAEQWGNIVYAFCEDNLTKACEEYFTKVRDEYQQAVAENYAGEAR